MSDETKKLAHNRDRTGKFLPGVSGNPGGRPAIPPQVREAARAHGLEAIERLVHWMRSDDPAASIPATKILLERGFGKSAILVGTEGVPLVNIQIGNGEPIRNAHDAAAAYAYLVGNPAADMSGLDFAAPEPAQAATQPIEVSTPVEPITLVEMPPDPPEQPVDEEQRQLWVRLGK